MSIERDIGPKGYDPYDHCLGKPRQGDVVEWVNEVPRFSIAVLKRLKREADANKVDFDAYCVDQDGSWQMHRI